MLTVPPELRMTSGELRALLAEFGFARSRGEPSFERLSGGVSSAIFKVRVGANTFCVKKPLERLEVEKEWIVPTDRVVAEVKWLNVAQRLAPGHSPQVLGFSEKHLICAMEYLDDESYQNWKANLMNGLVRGGTGKEVASLLVSIHSKTAKDPSIERDFPNYDNFFLLRLEPYLIESARTNPDLSCELVSLVHELQSCKVALVHGDVSPKNILFGPSGPMLIDAECACMGDPGFDVAFVLTHLLLKVVARPGEAIGLFGLVREICDTYFDRVDWEETADLESRVARLIPGLLLSRVDGRSPVEYLSDSQRILVRVRARELLQTSRTSIDDLLEFWEHPGRQEHR